MAMGERIAVALSGGADSAVAALFLRDAGYEVLALTMVTRGTLGTAAEIAEAVARRLGIEFCAVDLGREFEDYVVKPFREGYQSGITPNPCVECNRRIKFGFLLERALEKGAVRMATGHFARTGRGADGMFRLYRAADRSKDQSYVLWGLDQEKLSRTVFPLGNFTKKDVLEKARKAGLDCTAPESQDICFIKGKSYREIFKENAASFPGPIVDCDGNRLGTHRGLPCYTVGQRRGLGLSVPGAMYIIEIRYQDNAIVVGGRNMLYCRSFTVGGLSFISERPERALACQVKTRYRGPLLPAFLSLEGDKALVEYPEKGPLPAPGQSAVFYRGDELLGGGIIERN